MKKICKKFKSYAARFADLKSHKSGISESESLNEYNFDQVSEVTEENFPQKEKASFWTTFKWLLWRCMKQQYLDPAFLAAKVLQIFGTSITIGKVTIKLIMIVASFNCIIFRYFILANSMGWHLYRQRYIYIDFGTFCHGHMLFNLFSFHDCRRVPNADARLTARDLQSTLFRNRFLSINITVKMYWFQHAVWRICCLD